MINENMSNADEAKSNIHITHIEMKMNILHTQMKVEKSKTKKKKTNKKLAKWW